MGKSAAQFDFRHNTSSLFPAVPPSLRLSVITLLVTLLLPATGFAQKNQRPKLLPAARKDLAGKIILLPQDDRYLEFKMMAQIADHYLILPPSRFLAPEPRPAELVEWLKGQDLAGVTGILISLDANIPELFPVLKQFRAQNSKLPIYGFASLDSSTEASKQSCQSAIDLAANGWLDFLLIGQDEDLNAKPAQIARARLIGDAASREIGEKVAFASGQTSLPEILLAKMLAQRFGRSPKVLPVYSSNEGRTSKDSDTVSLNQIINAKIKLLGGSVMTQNQESAPQVDALLFIHTPQTSEAQRTDLVMSVLQTIDSGVRVTFLDLSESKQTKEAMLSELRNHKLLGKLTSYASAAPGDSSREAINRALAQTSIFFTAIKSLRDDIDRVHRIERAQINLLFSRILEDWGYDLIVRPQLEEFARTRLQTDPSKLGDKTERAETFANDALRKLATELFDEQFNRNVHAILMNSGTRIQFRISMLQQLQVRFPSQNTAEPEIRQIIHTFFEGYLPGGSSR